MFEESAYAIPSSLWASMNSWLTPTVLFVLLNVMIGTIALTSTLANQKQHQTNSQQNEPNQPRLAKYPSVLQRLKSINFHTHHYNNRSQEPQNSSLNHKQNPDSSDTHFNQTLETQSNYFFQQAPHENLQIPDIFQQNPQETQTQFVFDQKDSNLDDFQQTHEQNPQETQIPFVFDRKDSNLNDFPIIHEEKVEENDLQSMDEVYRKLTGSHFSRTTSDTEPASGKIPAKLPEKMRKSASMKSPFGHFEEEDNVEVRRPATVRERGSNAKATDGDEEVDSKADDFINKFKQQLKLQRLDSIIRYKDMIGRGSER